MSIQAVHDDLKALKSITAELKKLNLQCKDLRQNKKIIEGKVMEYLVKIDKPGLKFENIIIVNKERTIHKPLKKKEKMLAVTEHLEKLGIKNPENEAKNLFENVMRGEAEDVNKLKITQFEVNL